MARRERQIAQGKNQPPPEIAVFSDFVEELRKLLRGTPRPRALRKLCARVHDAIEEAFADSQLRRNMRFFGLAQIESWIPGSVPEGEDDPAIVEYTRAVAGLSSLCADVSSEIVVYRTTSSGGGGEPKSETSDGAAAGEDTKQKVVKAPCNNCGPDKLHTVVGQHEVHDTEEVIEEGQLLGEISWRYDYELLECRACRNVRLRATYQDDGTIGPEVTYYPPAVSRRLPNWHGHLPPRMENLLAEVYRALHTNSRRLATMGSRALLDMAILDKVGDVGSFKRKLDALQTRGYLGQVGREILEPALEAGHAASHRGHAPKPKEVNRVMDIIENLLQSIYVLEPAAKVLKKITPKRGAGRKPKSGGK